MSDDTNTDELDDTVEETTEALPTKESATDPAEPAAGTDPAASDEKPKRTVGLRKPTGRERGAMAATAMAAVPATGVVGSIVYGNFGPAGLAATAATGLAAGGVALAVRAKRRAEERAKAKDAKPGMPPHSLGGLKGLLAGTKEKAAARRQQMAERRAGRQGRGLGGLAGGLGGAGRRVAGAAGGAAGPARGALGRGTGAGRAAAGVGGAGSPARGRHAAAGKASTGRAAMGRPGVGARHAAAGSRPTAGGRVAGRAAGGGRAVGAGRPTGGSRGGSGRYINPATGRPMTPGQVSSAIRRQRRAQRIVANGGGYPKQALRWAGRHPKAVGIAAAGIGGLAAVVMFAPLAAAAGVGLGMFGAARHPAFRAAIRGTLRGAGLHSVRGWRWLRGQWGAWRRSRRPLEGELIDEPPMPPPEPDIVDAEVVEEPKAAIGQPTLSTAPPSGPADQPAAAPPPAHAPPHRQPRLITAGNATPNTEEKNTMSHPFETANETLNDVSFTPESGAHAEAAVDAIPGVLSSAAASIRSVLASVAEHLPQAADSLEHLNGIADAVDGISSQADEQIAGWKQSANWVWQGQD